MCVVRLARLQSNPHLWQHPLRLNHLHRTITNRNDFRMNTAIQPTKSPGRLGQIEKWVPGLRAMRNYQRAWLPRDLVAGLVLSTLLVPQRVAYAEVAMEGFWDERRRAEQSPSSIGS